MGGAAASHWKTERAAHAGLDIWIAPLYTSEATSALNRTPAKESAGIKIGMLRSRSHTNDTLIPQLALLVSVRKGSVCVIIMNPSAKDVHGGEFEYLGTGLLMLISITQQQ